MSKAGFSRFVENWVSASSPMRLPHRNRAARRRPAAVALAGSSKRKWLEENAKAADLKLSAATLQALDAAFKSGIAPVTGIQRP
jgi:aryl-alcohol dehydrogenase-like predicted oxidoreductase